MITPQVGDIWHWDITNHFPNDPICDFFFIRGPFRYPNLSEYEMYYDVLDLLTGRRQEVIWRGRGIGWTKVA